MLKPKLIYTAIARAKEKLALVGDLTALEIGCKNKPGRERKTIGQLIYGPERIFQDTLDIESTLASNHRI